MPRGSATTWSPVEACWTSIKKTIAAAALGILVAVPAHSAAAKECPDSRESSALLVRSLQTELMVAALTCGAQDRYNTFSTRFQDVLVRNGKTMTAYFNRRYGSRGRKELDHFVTMLANDASTLSVSQGRDVCQSVVALFDEVLRLDKEELEAFSAQRSKAVLKNPEFCDRSPSGLASGG